MPKKMPGLEWHHPPESDIIFGGKTAAQASVGMNSVMLVALCHFKNLHSASSKYTNPFDNNIKKEN